MKRLHKVFHSSYTANMTEQLAETKFYLDYNLHFSTNDQPNHPIILDNQHKK